MEYLIGSGISFIAIITVLLVVRPQLSKKPVPIRYSQSHIYNLIDPFIPTNNEMKTTPITQATKYYEETFIRVAYVDSKAYWIQDNSFCVADIIDGQVDPTTTRQVDTMSMSKLELNKMLYIIEELTGGKSDNSNSGDTKF